MSGSDVPFPTPRFFGIYNPRQVMNSIAIFVFSRGGSICDELAGDSQVTVISVNPYGVRFGLVVSDGRQE
jgi:hypothetical protein